MKNILKVCLVSAFGLALLQAVPNFKGEKVAANEFESGVVTRAGGLVPFNSLVYLGSISLGSNAGDYLKRNKVYKLSFVSPVTGYLVAQTNGGDSTSLCVETTGTQGYRIFDDGTNSGDHNAKVKFHVSKNQTVNFYIKRTLQLSGANLVYTGFTVRKMSMSIIANPDYDSSYYHESDYWGALYPAINKFDYTFDNSYGPLTDTFFGYFKKDIMLFSGGGNTANGYPQAYTRRGTISFPHDIDSLGCEIAIWGALATAETEIRSLAYSSVQMGAKCSIAFKSMEDNMFVWNHDVHEFIFTFFDYLEAPGTTVANALLYTSQECSTFADIYDNIVVCGNENYKFFNKTASHGTFTIPEVIEDPFLPPIVPIDRYL